ncbi:hypothetical protein MTO96_028088 [Rhipicephalus appendiculatus]
METAEAAEEDEAEKKPAAEAAKKEDSAADAAEPMEQGDEAEESENKETKPPAAVTAESKDSTKPVEKEKGAASSSPEKSGSDKPAAEARSPEKAASEKPTPEKQSPEKTALEKPSAEKASPEKVSPVKPSPEKPSAEKPSPEKISPAKPSVEKPSVEKSSPEKPSSERPAQPSVTKPAVEKATPEKATPEKTAPEKATPEKASTEKQAAEVPSPAKPSPVKPAAEKPSPEKPSSEKPSAVKPSTERPSVEKPSPEKTSIQKSTPDKPPVPENLSPVKAPTSVKPDTEKPSPVRPVPERAPLPKPSPEKPSFEKPSTEKQPSFENKFGATNLSTSNAANLEKAAPPKPAPSPEKTSAMPKENGDVGSQHGVFSVSWLDLVSDPNAERALRQARDVDVLALQGVEPGHWGVLTAQLPEGCELLRGTGLALVVRRSAFRVVEHSSHSLQSLVAKDLESLEEADREAVRNHLRLTPDGHLLTVRLQPLLGGQPTVDSQRHLVVANAALSPASPSVNALQVCCVARELCREVVGATPAGRMLVGRLHVMPGSPAYQLLRDGYLDDDMIEELQRHRNVVLPGRESRALVNLLWKAFQHPSSSLRSCYTAKAEEGVPAQCPANSPAWFSSENLRLQQPLAEGSHLARLAFCSP